MNLLAELSEVSKVNLCKSFCEEYKKNPDTKIIIFGAGDGGMFAVAILTENNMKPSYFCDNDVAKQGMLIKNTVVIAPEEITNLAGNIMILNTDSYRHEKEDQLLALGVDRRNIWSFDLFNPFYKKLTYDYLEKNRQKFEEVYAYLYDEYSKCVFLDYLKGASSGDLSWYEKKVSKPEYFPEDIVPRLKNHIFLDVGAYNGNTIEEFISFTGNEYEKIYAFEPFLDSVKKIEDKSFPRVEVFSAAASNKCGEKTFYCNEYGDLTMVTTILEEGANHKALSFATITIDEALHGRKATFIKMDIEGSELDALHGACRTIKKYKPFLAICVYHKREDLITILPYIESIVPEYRFYLRHHANTPSDLVLYCSCE